MRMRCSPAPSSCAGMAERQRPRVGERLAESVLDAAGSLFQLQEELARISLRHDSLAADSSSCEPRTPPSVNRAHSSSKKHRSRKKRERKRAPGVCGVFNDRGRRDGEPHDALSLGSNESCEQQSFSASSSSRYDSAIGSLHSQTDNDSLDSRLSISAAPERGPPSQSLPSPVTLLQTASSARNTSVTREAIVKHYYSPRPSIPTVIIAENGETKDQLNEASRNGAESLKSQVMVMGERVQLRQKKNREKVHNPLTAGDVKKHFEWLESSGKSVGPTNETDPDKRSPLTGFESEGSSSTVVAEEEEKEEGVKVGTPHEYRVRPKSDSDVSEEHSLSLSEYLPQKEKQISVQGPHPPSKQVNMPQRYNTGLVLREKTGQQRRPPQRAPSILQRLRRRQHGSFRQDTRSRPRRMPVQRSLSDRFVYHLKRKWETSHQGNPYPISTPSHLRPIGRLLRTYTGKLHVIQLHRPANGQYGIYITQGVDRKIFISRFATPTAEKFYAGLLSPGDELVSVNKLKVRGKSLDLVYSILSQLDSVIIAVVPVTAHRNW